MNKYLKKGFTLIELIIVVSIIALISGISLFALNNARVSGRDVRRKADLEEIASGLELYKADLNYYPASVSFDDLLKEGANIYIQAVPNDPNTSNDYRYIPFQLGCNNSTVYCTRYVLWTFLEAQPAPNPASYCNNNPNNCDSSTSACNYCRVNP